jgi:hypothetical protein
MPNRLGQPFGMVSSPTLCQSSYVNLRKNFSPSRQATPLEESVSFGIDLNWLAMNWGIVIDH